MKTFKLIKNGRHIANVYAEKLNTIILWQFAKLGYYVEQ